MQPTPLNEERIVQGNTAERLGFLPTVSQHRYKCNFELTLISAPAGFGKTTLLSEWVTSFERPVAWLSLDEEDKDPTRFLIYLVAALQTIVPDIGAGVLGMLHPPQPPPAKSILTTLINEITSLTNDFSSFSMTTT